MNDFMTFQEYAMTLHKPYRMQSVQEREFWDLPIEKLEAELKQSYEDYISLNKALGFIDIIV